MNSRATSKQVLLHNFYESGTTGTTETYTPAVPLDLINKYRKITIIMSGTISAALETQLKINAATAYDCSYLLMDTTTVSGALLTSQGAFPLVPAVLSDGAGTYFTSITDIFVLRDGSENPFLQITCSAQNPAEGQQHTYGYCQTGASTITSIELKVSTSSWKKGTQITIYGQLY